MDCSMSGFPALHYLPEFAQTHVHWVSDAIQLSHPLSSPSPLVLSLSQHQGLSNKWALCITWSKHQNFSFSINPSDEYSRLISFGIDWFDLLAVWGTLKSLLQHSSSKASFLGLSVSFMVQLSHLSITTGKTRALTVCTFVGKVMSLLYNMWLLWWPSSEESACNAGNLGLNLGSGRSPREGNGYLLQYSCLENPMDRGAWWACKELDTTELT